MKMHNPMDNGQWIIENGDGCAFRDRSRSPKLWRCLDAFSLTPPSPILKVEGEPSDVRGLIKRFRAIAGLGLLQNQDRELSGVNGN
jgi:hypothetical protein